MKVTHESGEGALLQDFRRGDPQAFQTVFEGHGGVLERSIRRALPQKLRRRVSVADVLQDVRLVAFERRHHFRGRDLRALRRWLLGIARFRALRAVQEHTEKRKRDIHREVTRGRRITTAAFAGGDASPSQIAIAGELNTLARQALERLPEDYREVLQLVLLEEVSYGETARRMGRSVEAVRKLHGRALVRLAAVFDQLRGESHA